MVSHRSGRKEEEGSDEDGGGGVGSHHRVREGRVEREVRQRWEKHGEVLARINGEIEAQVLGCSVRHQAVSMAIASHGLAVPGLIVDEMDLMPDTSQIAESSLLNEAVSLAIMEKGLRPLSSTNT